MMFWQPHSWYPKLRILKRVQAIEYLKVFVLFAEAKMLVFNSPESCKSTNVNHPYSYFVLSTVLSASHGIAHSILTEMLGEEPILLFAGKLRLSEVRSLSQCHSTSWESVSQKVKLIPYSSFLLSPPPSLGLRENIVW